MQSYLKFGDDAKIASASPQGPVQVGILGLVCAYKRAVGGHEGEADHVVTRQTVKASEPASAAPEDKAARSGVRNDPGGKHQAVALRGFVYIAKQAAASESRTPRWRVDFHVAQARKIDYQPPVATAKPRQAMTAATYCCENPRIGRRSHREPHISHAGAARYGRRRSRNHRVPDSARFGKLGSAIADQVAVKPATQCAKEILQFGHHGPLGSSGSGSSPNS